MRLSLAPAAPRVPWALLSLSPPLVLYPTSGPPAAGEDSLSEYGTRLPGFWVVSLAAPGSTLAPWLPLEVSACGPAIDKLCVPALRLCCECHGAVLPRTP